MMGPPTGARAAEAPERLKVLRDLPRLYAILAYLVHKEVWGLQTALGRAANVRRVYTSRTRS